MAKNPYKETIKQLFDLRKKAMSKNATEQDVLRYTYFSMEVVKDNLQEESFTALLGAVYSAKFKKLGDVQEVACKLMQARTAPALFYNEDVSSTSADLASEVRNRADVMACVENSNWKRYATQYFQNKNLESGKIEDYTKALMLIEQVGMESSVVATLQKYTKAKLPAFVKKSHAKRFLNCELEIQSTITKAKIAVLGGQEKYDELMKIINGEVTFDEYANGVLKQALKVCNGFNQLVAEFARHEDANIPTKGDYRVAHRMRILQSGKLVSYHAPDGACTMAAGMDVLGSELISFEQQVVRCQKQHGIYQNPIEEVQVQERVAPVVEETHDTIATVDGAGAGVSFLDGDDTVM